MSGSRLAGSPAWHGLAQCPGYGCCVALVFGSGLWLGSWLGCAVWVRVLGLGFRLRPATPGSGNAVCVCLCACSACTLPLRAGTCGVGVCAWALVSAAPRHSWLGCWGLCVFVCALRLYPATPGWGVRWGCVCFGSGFGCAPPLLAGVLGPLCACVAAPLVPRHSWLGCAVRLCVLGLGFQLFPATPGWGVGACVCLCAGSACTPPLLAGVCGVGVCALARVSAAPRHSLPGCWGVRVLVCALRLYPATPGWGVRCGCVCLDSGFGCAPPLLAGLLGCVCASVRAPLVPRHSLLGCAVWVCVLGLGFRLRPATPGRGVGVCVCLCARSACTPPLLAGVCVVGVCALARVSAAPRHSWPGCWGVCVLLCALRLYPATPGWGVRCGCVCFGSGFGCAPPLLAGVLGCVCACARYPLVSRHSLLGCALWVCVLGLGFRLRPATPGRGVRVCVCFCARSACTPPLLAGMCGVGVCAWARISAAPRHSWLGCWGVCVFVCALRLYHATRGSVVPCGCVCWGSGFGCAPPLLAGVLGCVCACVRAPLVPRHSWLGCTVWVCVLGLGFWLRPATPGWGVRVCVCLVRAPLVPRHSWLGCAVWVCVLWLGFRLRPATPGRGVGVCVCLCALSACIPPLLAGLCAVGVCAWARVSAAPRHSWSGCSGVCVLLCALRLYSTTPGWDVRCGCVCLGSDFGCAPPLLAGVLGCVCVCVRSPFVPCHSWIGCAVWVRVLGLGFRLRPATPGWGVGVCVCLCARSACTPPLLAGVCGLGVCAWARVLAAPRHSWLGCSAVCVLGARSACAPPLLAGVCGVGVCVWARDVAPPRLSWLGCWGVRVCVRAPLVPRHSWLVCAVWVCVWARVSAAPRHSWLGCWGVCVFVCALRLYPAPTGCGVRLGLVWLGSGFGCAPPLLPRVLGCVCACVCASLVARHSWLGCAVWVSVLGLGFRLRPATPGRVVGLCVCVCVLALLVPRHSWLGCAVWVGVLGLGFPLRPASPGWGVGVCMCVFVCLLRLYPATPGWGVRAWAGVSAAPRHSCLGCWGVCVLVCALRLCPATPGWGVRCGCLCSGSGFGCAPPLRAGVLGCLCVFVCLLRLYPATPGWGARCGWVCLGSGFGCAPPLLAGVLGCVCVCLCACSACTPPLLAGVCVLGLGFRLRPATPGWGVGVYACLCALSACSMPLLAGVCVLGLGFRLRSATPGWGVRVCVCLCARSACTPPLLAWVCGVWVWCCVAPVPVPWFVGCCARCPGLRHPVAVVAWHLSACLGSGRRRASLACLVALLGCAAPRPVRLLSVLRSAFPMPWCRSPPRGLAPPGLLGGCAGHAEAGRELGSLCLPLAPAEAGALGPLRVVPVRGPSMGLSLAAPSGVGLGLRALRWLACVDPVTDASGFPYRPSFNGGLRRCTGAVSCGRRHRPFWVGGRHARVLCVCACACPSWPGRAGRPPGLVVVRLTFSCGRSCCALCLLGSLRAGVAPFFFAPRLIWRSLFSGPGCPLLVSCPPPPFFFSPSPFFFLVRPRCLWRSVFSGPGCLGPWRLLVSPSLPFFFLAFPRSSCSSSPGFFFFAFFSLCALVVSCVPCFPARGALGLGVFLSPPPPLFSFFFLLFLGPFFPPPLAFFFCAPVVSGVPCVPAWAALGLDALLSPPPPPPPVVFSFLFSFCFLFFFPRLCLAGGAVRGWRVCPGLWGVLVCASVVLSLSLLFVRCSLAPLALAGVVWCCPSCLGVCCGAWLSSVAFWWVLVSCLGGAVPVWPRGSQPCGLVWCVLVFRCPVLSCVVLCCRVVVCCRALLFVCVVACACCLFPAAGRLLCVFWGPVLCVACPLRPVRCCAALCWGPSVVLSAWSALSLVLGAVGSWCRCVFLGSAGGSGCLVLSFGGVCRPCCPCLAASPIARRLPCGVLFPCVVSCGAVLPRGAVLWCPVVFFFFSFFLPCLVVCFP